MNLSISQVAQWIGARTRLSDPGAVVERLLIDSRSLHTAPGTLFVALKTESNDGHKYIEDLYQRGVRLFLVEEGNPLWRPDVMPEASFLAVGDTLEALQGIGAYSRLALSCPVLAITGSNGKTIVKEWIWQLLRNDISIGRSPGSYNSRIGVPMSLSAIDQDVALAVVEAGISQVGEMDRLERIIRPDFGLMTHLGVAHLEHFASKSELLEEKARLFAGCRRVVFSLDDEEIRPLSDRLEGRGFAWTATGKTGAQASFRLRDMGNGTEILTDAFGHAFRALLPYTDRASVENALHALSFACLLQREGLYRADAQALARRVESLEPVAMRLEVKEGFRGCVLIDDTYNADLQALDLALDFQARRPIREGMHRSLVLSDIAQSGLSAGEWCRRVADLCRRWGIGRFVGIGPELASHAGFFPEETSHFFLTTEDFLASTLPEKLHDELILVKGSRRFGFERITARLAYRQHDTRLEVNLDALVHNFNYFKSLIKPQTKLTAMVKAEAYGLGALEVSKTLQAQGCDVLAVAVADEGVRLRQGGIVIPIMVMNPDVSVLPLCYQYNLEPEVYSFALLKAFLEAGLRLGVKGYPIHVKLDTGMHRLGFSQDDLAELIRVLSHQQVLSVASVFTHLAGSDEARFDDYTQSQWTLFDAMSSRVCSALPYPVDRHILNSAGIERFTPWQCERVRLGIGLYGISAVDSSVLRPVASLKTHILQIHAFHSGDSIGYSRTVTLSRDSRIATIPIGYADGFNRHNKGFDVLVNGQRAKVVGNICMDACMVDVTGLAAEEGDPVEIFGEGLPLSEVAARLETIPYEVLTGVSQRVKRVYFHE